MVTKQQVTNSIADITDGGGVLNTAAKVRDVLENKIFEFVTQNSSIEIFNSDCNFLDGVTYEWTMPDPSINSITLNGRFGTGNGLGFVLNKITPHIDIPDGHMLLMSFVSGAGLTYLTKSGVSSNFIFAKEPSFNSPKFGTRRFIGQNSSNLRSTDPSDFLDGVPIGYESNLKVLVIYSKSQSRWVEIHRSGGDIY